MTSSLRTEPGIAPGIAPGVERVVARGGLFSPDRTALLRAVPTGPPANRPDPDSHDWSLQAACLDDEPDLFFPVGQTTRAAAQFEEARAVCLGCPVRVLCLELALRVGADHGMWGGTTPTERKRIARRLALRSPRRS